MGGTWSVLGGLIELKARTRNSLSTASYGHVGKFSIDDQFSLQRPRLVMAQAARQGLFAIQAYSECVAAVVHTLREDGVVKSAGHNEKP